MEISLPMMQIGKAPTFFLVGAAKGGTTFLAGLLDQHPEIFVTKPKEPQFFTWRFEKGWEWYESCFDGAEMFPIRGDASALYSAMETYPDCLPRLANYFPSAKIIYLVRDPLARIASFWLTHVRASWLDPLPFEEAVKKDGVYIDSTQYWKHYKAYRKYFGAENVKVLFFKDLIQNPQIVASDCAAFLHADPSFKYGLDSVNKNPSIRKRRPKQILRIIKRNLKNVDTFYALLPEVVQNVILKVFKEKIEIPRYSPELRSWVLDKVREDSLALLDHFGKPPSYWDIQVDY